MMQKICSADGIPLINIVRSKEQVDLLRGIGAVHVLNSVDGDFRDRLIDAIAETDATIAFDAIGGGTMGDQILQAMERAAVRKMTNFVRTEIGRAPWRERGCQYGEIAGVAVELK